MKRILLLSMTIALVHLYAQAQVSISDENLQDQLRSMETGPVNFSPKDYYMAFHDNGLGRDGYSVYHWHFPTLKHLLGYWELSVERSKAKPLIQFYRTPRIGLEILNKGYAKTEMEQTDEQLEIETKEAIDRQVDLAYDKYKDIFNESVERINGKLQYCLRVSSGEMLDHVSSISSMSSRLCDEISYVHKDISVGVGNDMTLADREKEYMRIEKSFDDIEKVTNILVKHAVMNYDSK